SRILLIDDDDAVRTMLRITLAEFGHTVTEARNGIEGLAIFPATGVDLVITDIVMPGKEGIEVIQELRLLHPQLKIIAISGGGRVGPSDYLRIALFLGAARVLAKPFSNQELLLMIEELLPPAASVTI
ncbi:MAG: response regulator, partial [Opitutus sp.]